MKTIYRTFDGEEFLDRSNAVEHEARLVDKLLMWNEAGEFVTDTRLAYYVWTGEPLAAYSFCELAKEYEDWSADGIDTSIVGAAFYIWDEDQDCYIRKSSHYLKGMARIVDMVRDKGGID